MIKLFTNINSKIMMSDAKFDEWKTEYEKWEIEYEDWNIKHNNETNVTHTEHKIAIDKMKVILDEWKVALDNWKVTLDNYKIGFIGLFNIALIASMLIFYMIFIFCTILGMVIMIIVR